MALSDRAEEILETLWLELVEVKKENCDASLLKDDQVAKELTDSGYIDIKENKINLTNKGREEARDCARRHRLAERMFVDLFDIKKKQVHEPSCKFEHILHKGLDETVCTLLGHPKTCPHGKAIPEGVCCRQAKKIPQKLIMSLIDLPLNKKAKVSYLQTLDRGILQKIMAIGALPNTDIILIHKFPSYVMQIGKSQFAIDKELASHIYARLV